MASSDGFIYLLQNQTSNVTTAAQHLNLGNDSAVIDVWGTWDGATVTIQTSTIPDSNGAVTWITVTDRFNVDFSFTDNTQITLTEFVYNQDIRAVVTNAGASTDLNCTLRPI